MGGIELGSSDKHTQNHTYPQIARNPELRGIRGGSFMPIKPRLPKDSLLELRDGGRDALRSSDHAQTRSGSGFRLRVPLRACHFSQHRLSSKTHGHEKLHTIPTNIRAKRPGQVCWASLPRLHGHLSCLHYLLQVWPVVSQMSDSRPKCSIGQRGDPTALARSICHVFTQHA